MRQFNPWFSGREDMAKERAQASFNTREMTYFMDGGEENTKVTQIAMDSIGIE